MSSRAMTASELGVQGPGREAPAFPWFYSAFVLLCVVQFSNAWYWPVHPDFGSLNTPRFDKIFGPQFQYSMWALISVVVLLHVLQRGVHGLVAILAPWMPFWLVGVLAGVLGIDPVASLRHSVFWLTMALSAAVAGSELTPEQTLDALCASLLAVLAASVVIATMLPDAGTQSYGTSTVWSGVFVSKNQLGWVAALALMLGLHGVARRASMLLPGCLLVLAIVCLLKSQSKGSLVAAAAGAAYMLALGWSTRRFTDGMAAFVTIVLALATLVFSKLALPLVLEMLGRDATLTGRTDIWDVYLAAMLKTPWLGQGPGAFTGLSTITEKLAQMLSDLGGIYTPHNMFLGAFGDAGAVGLLSFCGSLLYLGIVDPIRSGSLLSKALAGMCVVTLVGGMVEAHEVYTMGIGGFLLVLVRAVLVSERDGAAAAGAAA
jgi:O-antigen ligase